MKVEKEKFDALLENMLKQKPEKTSAIKSSEKPEKIIPPKTPAPAQQQ
jgi:hypothetical protein